MLRAAKFCLPPLLAVLISGCDFIGSSIAAAPIAEGKVVLAGNGIVVEGERLAFGTSRERLEQALTPFLYEPGGYYGGESSCEHTEFDNGFMTSYINDRFVGWDLADADEPVRMATDQNISTASNWQMVSRVYNTQTVEFVEDEEEFFDARAGIGGSSMIEDGKRILIGLHAGNNCSDEL